MANIGELIKRLREERGWSQAELARRAGITQAMISYLETGKRSWHLLSVGAAQRLARSLGVSIGYFEASDDESQMEPATEAMVGA
jgi:transcriptional regulator with XRE-family HTH domain